MSKTGELYVQVQAGEAKHYPFYGDHTFSGDYEGLCLAEKMRGLLRTMMSAVETEQQMHGEAVGSATKHFAQLILPNGTDADHRVYKRIKGVHKTTSERLQAHRESIEALYALIDNAYGKEGKEGPAQESPAAPIEGSGDVADDDDDSGDSCDEDEPRGESEHPGPPEDDGDDQSA